MTDLAAPRYIPKSAAVLRDDYLGMVRRKRLYGGVLLLFFAVVFASGWQVAEGRNAGGFWSGLSHVFQFPAEVIREAWEKRALVPAVFLSHIPSLIETLNIALVSTLLGGGWPVCCRCLPPTGWRLGPGWLGCFGGSRTCCAPSPS
jgi:ABC-type phosphate/phosphonate transport system permease subunit